MTVIDYALDPATGIAIVQPSPALFAPRLSGTGTITYRCHTCGDLIPKRWEVWFWDPQGGWCGYILPPVMPASMTTHHDWHMAARQGDTDG